MRVLIRWMAVEGYGRFADLDREAAQRFLTMIAVRPGNRSGKTVSEPTQQSYRHFLVTLYAQGSRYGSVATADPFPGGAVRGPPGERGWLPYTPDEIAVPLVAAALRLTGPAADDVIALQARAQAAYDEALAGGIDQSRAGFVAIDAISNFSFITLTNETVPWHSAKLTSTKQVRVLVDRLYDACFIVIAYLVRCARIGDTWSADGVCRAAPICRRNRAICLPGRPNYKTARDTAGTAHRWVAPEAVERAIQVMERLSEPLRRRTGRTDLWLVMASTGLIGPAAKIETPVSGTIISRLNNSFAPFIDLPLHNGKSWHLNTHQGSQDIRSVRRQA